MGIKVRLIEGAPIVIGDRKLTPVLRAIGWKQRWAEIGQDRTRGFGFVAAWLQPVAVLEETAEGRRRIPIRNETIRALLPLLVSAFVVPPVLSLLVRLVGAKD